MSSRAQAVLTELLRVRDAAAREHDVPPRSLLKDEILVALAKKPVHSMADLARVTGLPRPVRQACGDEIVKATRKGLAVPHDQLPSAHRVQETACERVHIDSLWATVQSLCFGRSIDPGLVTSRQEIARFCRAAAAKGPVTRMPLMQGWRGELLGELLTAFVAGRGAITLDWPDGRLRATHCADAESPPRTAE